VKTATRLAICLLLFLAACGSAPDLEPGSPLTLASFTQSEVDVTITLEQDESGQVYLAATFVPEEGEHLYSKDIPVTGVDGL